MAPNGTPQEAPAGEKAAATGATQPPGTPGPTVPMENPTKAAEKAAKTTADCKKAIAEFGAKPSGLKSLPEKKRTDLLSSIPAQELVICLAVANGNRGYCDELTGDAKTKCAARYAQTREIKGLPKGHIKGHLIHQLCVRDSPKADCDLIQAAINAGDAAKCEGISTPSLRSFCPALATGDVAKCKDVPAGEQRSYCEAYAGNDPSRCPKDSNDCRNLAGAFAGFSKQGLAGVEDIDPATAAAVKGKAACKALLEQLEKTCTGLQ